jgi:P27 family predicted phage terminase small subunit
VSGPPPLPTDLRILRGNPGKRPINRREPQPSRSEVVPDTPDVLTGYACDEWHRVAGELHRLGLLTVLEQAPLAAYCSAYARWRTAEELLADMAKQDGVTRGLLISGPHGDARANPLVKLSIAAAEQMDSIAALFGMAPSARARISAGVRLEPAAGKFAG